MASNGPSTDWKEVTMLRLMEEDEKEAKEEAERMEVLRKEAEISPADTSTSHWSVFVHLPMLTPL